MPRGSAVEVQVEEEGGGPRDLRWLGRVTLGVDDGPRHRRRPSPAAGDGVTDDGGATRPCCASGRRPAHPFPSTSASRGRPPPLVSAHLADRMITEGRRRGPNADGWSLLLGAKLPLLPLGLRLYLRLTTGTVVGGGPVQDGGDLRVLRSKVFFKLLKDVLR